MRACLLFLIVAILCPGPLHGDSAEEGGSSEEGGSLPGGSSEEIVRVPENSTVVTPLPASYVRNGVIIPGYIPPIDHHGEGAERQGEMESEIINQINHGLPGRRRKRFLETLNLWENGIVPYEFSTSRPISNTSKERVIEAMALVERMTCVRFFVNGAGGYTVPHTTYLTFIDGTGCYSSIGRTATNAQNISPCTNFYTVLHEIFHALGSLHEQSHFIRDKNTQIRLQNVVAGKEHNFDGVSESRKANFVYNEYDHQSTMHYDNFAFSKNGFRTVDPYYDDIGIFRDDYWHNMKEVNEAYQCTSLCTGTVPTCQNEGYAGYADGQCTCICPEGLDPAANCASFLSQYTGSIVSLSTSNRVVPFSSPNPIAAESSYMWIIQAPEGSQISVKITDSNIPCESLLTVKRNLLGQNGTDYCGSGLFQKSLVSLSSAVGLILTAGTSTTTFVEATATLLPADEWCYNLDDAGETYDGPVNRAEDNSPCLKWSETTSCDNSPFSFSNLPADYSGNECRNPGGVLRSPWCYTDVNAGGCVIHLCDVCGYEGNYDSYDDCAALIAADANYCTTADAEKGCRLTCNIASDPVISGATCGPPPAVLGGTLQDATKASYAVSETVNYVCDLDSAIVKTRYCLSTGEWSQMPAVCNGVFNDPATTPAVTTPAATTPAATTPAATTAAATTPAATTPAATTPAATTPAATTPAATTPAATTPAATTAAATTPAATTPAATTPAATTPAATTPAATTPVATTAAATTPAATTPAATTPAATTAAATTPAATTPAATTPAATTPAATTPAATTAAATTPAATTPAATTPAATTPAATTPAATTAAATTPSATTPAATTPAATTPAATTAAATTPSATTPAATTPAATTPAATTPAATTPAATTPAATTAAATTPAATTPAATTPAATTPAATTPAATTPAATTAAATTPAATTPAATTPAATTPAATTPAATTPAATTPAATTLAATTVAATTPDASTPVATTSAYDECDSGFCYDSASEMCYALLGMATSFRDAYFKCQSRGAEILTVKSQDVQNFVVSLRASQGAGANPVYMRAVSRPYSNRWYWWSNRRDRVRRTFNNWYTGRSRGPWTRRVLCSAIAPEAFDNKWYHVYCSSDLDVICQKPPNTDGSRRKRSHRLLKRDITICKDFRVGCPEVLQSFPEMCTSLTPFNEECPFTCGQCNPSGVTCAVPAPGGSDNVALVTTSASLNPGEVATYQCTLGVLISGTLKRACATDGTISGSTPICGDVSSSTALLGTNDLRPLDATFFGGMTIYGASPLTTVTRSGAITQWRAYCRGAGLIRFLVLRTVNNMPVVQGINDVQCRSNRLMVWDIPAAQQIAVSSGDFIGAQDDNGGALMYVICDDSSTYGSMYYSFYFQAITINQSLSTSSQLCFIINVDALIGPT